MIKLVPKRPDRILYRDRTIGPEEAIKAIENELVRINILKKDFPRILWTDKHGAVTVRKYPGQIYEFEDLVIEYEDIKGNSIMKSMLSEGDCGDLHLSIGDKLYDYSSFVKIHRPMQIQQARPPEDHFRINPKPFPNGSKGRCSILGKECFRSSEGNGDCRTCVFAAANLLNKWELTGNNRDADEEDDG